VLFAGIDAKDLDKLEELLDVMARNLSAALVRYDAKK